MHKDLRDKKIRYKSEDRVQKHRADNICSLSLQYDMNIMYHTVHISK